MIRVLHSVSNMARAGIETMLMNYYRHMDRDLLQFDFLANKPDIGAYDGEIRAMGGRVFVSPGLNPARYPAYRRFMARLVRANPELKIVHGHNEAMAYYALQSARDAGVAARIAHAHNTRIIRDYKYPLKLVCKQLLPGAATDYWACGRDAGIYYFGEKRWKARGEILRNAIDLPRFAFDPALREAVRREHGLSGSFLVGHVGRFNLQKNHTRLLDVFAEVYRARPEARLVLIGVGELEEETRRKALTLGLGKAVLFPGQTDRVYAWYQAMDCFVMPSLFEGLPVVGIEAQAAGLPCVFSEQVTDEVLIVPQASRLPLSADNSAWAGRILAASGGADRAAGAGLVREAGYDIVTEAEKLQNRYLRMAKASERKGS
ncbi:MAG: glycosyltransferase [Oscillospiraceae bacterium]|nr:glycosyltransferase [Oscillospiraceae bacterium]